MYIFGLYFLSLSLSAYKRKQDQVHERRLYTISLNIYIATGSSSMNRSKIYCIYTLLNLLALTQRTHLLLSVSSVLAWFSKVMI